ncbi:MAG: NAD(P)-dependent oxidoreductase [Burkholderiaceae bacterium]|uniref:NAD(P)-dependent oxidoreductase n=1 Tax=Cupriavidus metallidurans TaxID=119219 RepID=A0A482ISS0_9BURK|nr:MULTISPECIES: NAD(P)-dependent oxidoreductase [Cupriavidus]KWR83293.1 2-hydroxy-3-oxopropionate reductase [Cupriavidus sp. SHE]PCH55612.1 MAG: NAD(P)-dependent oxidoreductase [Burkholderiaceae bacterium]QBP10922.1 NAD(P)-dependent oxidoreductase [Cupriavidus metallidurans]QWC87985.1 NAD(P)-dependent oxidoreductase [Cupriavidus metallidurans]
MTTVAFIGLGAMGAPMVGHLIRAGHTVRAFVRRPEAADAARQLGAEPFFTPAEAAQGAAVVFTNVTSSEDVREVLLGQNGVVEGAAPGTICVDHSTISPIVTREIAQALAARGIEALDCPVSGGTVGAQAATLTIMVGGKAEVLEKVRPLLEQIGKTITHIGDSGAGQVAKLCNQIAQVVNIEGIAEAMRFAGAQGVDTAKVFQAMSTGMAGSRMLDMLGPKMVTRDFSAGIESRLHAKDFGLAADIATEIGLELPAMRATSAQLGELMDQGWGKDDTSSLLKVLELKG